MLKNSNKVLFIYLVNFFKGFLYVRYFVRFIVDRDEWGNMIFIFVEFMV